MAGRKLFISHSVKDVALADAIAKLLITTTSLNAEELISLSLEETGLPADKDLISHIEDQVGKPTSTIFLLTKNYLASRFCLCEMGAVWAMSQHIMPLIVRPVETKHLMDLIPAIHLKRIDDPDDLNSFISMAHKQLDLEDINLPRWAVEKKRFISEIKKQLS